MPWPHKGNLEDNLWLIIKIIVPYSWWSSLLWCGRHEGSFRCACKKLRLLAHFWVNQKAMKKIWCSTIFSSFPFYLAWDTQPQNSATHIQCEFPLQIDFYIKSLTETPRCVPHWWPRSLWIPQQWPSKLTITNSFSFLSKTGGEINHGLSHQGMYGRWKYM